MTTKIDITQLRKADIIVTTTDSTTSGVIRKATGSDYSHAILYLGNFEVIEAIDQGVKRRLWDKAINDPKGKTTLAVALRRRNMDETARQKVVEAALQYENLPYDIVGAVGSGMYGNTRGSAASAAIITAVCYIDPILCTTAVRSVTEIIENAKEENADKRFFCSELVTRAFTAAGYPIVDGAATWQTPRAVRTSPHLTYVGHLIG